MQYIIILAVAAVLLAVLGVSLQIIANISAWAILALCALVTFAMTVFFAVFLVKMLRGRRAKGRYLRADMKDSGHFKAYKSPVYLIDGKEHFGVFPADIRVFYRDGKEIDLRIDSKGFVYDTVTRVTIYTGIVLSAASTAGILMQLAAGG